MLIANRRHPTPPSSYYIVCFPTETFHEESATYYCSHLKAEYDHLNLYHSVFSSYLSVMLNKTTKFISHDYHHDQVF